MKNSGALGIAGGITITKTTSTKSVVIGEKMKDRVIPAAKELNADYYKGIRNYSKLEKILGDGLTSRIGMAHNKAWIQKEMFFSTKIIDIGSAGTNSQYYSMEKAATSNYWNYLEQEGW